MTIAAGELDRRITFYLPKAEDDCLSRVQGASDLIGQRWAKKTDISDGERIRAAQQGQELTTRFLVRHDSLTCTITGKHSLECEGVMYQVASTKEARGRRVGIEITATARPDRA